MSRQSSETRSLFVGPFASVPAEREENVERDDDTHPHKWAAAAAADPLDGSLKLTRIEHRVAHFLDVAERVLCDRVHLEADGALLKKQKQRKRSVVEGRPL